MGQIVRGKCQSARSTVLKRSSLKSRPKRIGINLLAFRSSRIAGVGRFFRGILEAFAQWKGAEFHIFCRRSFELEAFLGANPGFQYRRVDCPDFSSRFSRLLYEQLILPWKARNLDVLFSPCVSNPVLHPGFRTITTIHDLTPFFVAGKYGFVQGTYVRWITRLLGRSSSRIITVSEHSRGDLVEYLGIRPQRIDVVFNSVDPKDCGRVLYQNFFLCVGTLQPAKNVTSVLKAFARFKKQFDRRDHRLVIVGEYGWGPNHYKQLILDLGIQDCVEMKGYIDDAQLSELYANCKGIVLLSLYEGFGIPPLEGLSWNKPSIVSRISSLPEVVGRSGIQVNPTDIEEAARAMRDIGEEPERYLVGRDNQLAQFSPQKQRIQLIRALEKAVQGE